MPMAPAAPPLDPSTDANAGLNPVNFLMAAADLHKSGQLSAPVPTGTPLQTGKRASRKPIKVIK
jgi:hypothetical protein